MNINVGDWVRSYSKGVWQVVRRVPAHYEPRYSLNAPRELAAAPLFVLKRLSDDKGKKSFACESAHASLLKPISKADAGKLARLLDDPAIAAEFEAFGQPVNQMLNLPFCLAKRSEFRQFQQVMERAFAATLQDGLSSDDILKVIARGRHAAAYGQLPRNATLQFICIDLEVKRRQLVYRRLNVQDF